jgi:hypothetical protein
MCHFEPLAGSGTPRIEPHAVVPSVTGGKSICIRWIFALFFACLCVPPSTAQVSERGDP